MKEYIFIIAASMMFSVQFAFTKKYQQTAGTDLKASFLYNALSPILFALIMFFYDKCTLSITPFALIMSLLWAVVSNVITYFSIKALALGSLSNYSLFLLAGGMVLPAVYGAFFGDEFTLPRILGILLVLVAVFIRLDRKEKIEKKTILCFFMLFLLNGLISVIASIYQSDLFPFDKVSSTQFAQLRAWTTVLVGAIAFCVCWILEHKKGADSVGLKSYLTASPWAAISGLINGVANLLLLFALLVLEPSLQYPIITGGSIFLSVLVGLFFKEKPDRRTWMAVAFAVAGTIVMVF